VRRSLLVVLVVSGVLAAALGVVTNYASQVLPEFFAVDPLRVWLVFGLLVLAGIVAALIATRLSDSPSSASSSSSGAMGVPAYSSCTDSTRVPTLGATVRGRDREQRQLKSRRARGLVVLAGAGGMGKQRSRQLLQGWPDGAGGESIGCVFAMGSS
jgi:hypothetical protein